MQQITDIFRTHTTNNTNPKITLIFIITNEPLNVFFPTFSALYSLLTSPYEDGFEMDGNSSPLQHGGSTLTL